MDLPGPDEQIFRFLVFFPRCRENAGGIQSSCDRVESLETPFRRSCGLAMMGAASLNRLRSSSRTPRFKIRRHAGILAVPPSFSQMERPPDFAAAASFHRSWPTSSSPKC